MTAAEAELLRQVNEIARTEVSSQDYLELIRFGAATRLIQSRTPDPSEGRLGLPSWTAPRVAELAQAHVAAIRTAARPWSGTWRTCSRHPRHWMTRSRRRCRSMPPRR